MKISFLIALTVSAGTLFVNDLRTLRDSVSSAIHRSARPSMLVVPSPSGSATVKASPPSISSTSANILRRKRSVSPTPQPSATALPKPTAIVLPSATPTVAPIPTLIPTPSPSATPAPVPTSTPKPSSTPTPSPIQSPQTRKLPSWGAFVGWGTTPLPDFESRVGRQVEQEALFVHWGNENEFPPFAGSLLRDKNKTLIIFWEAMDYNIDGPNQPKFNYDAINNGNWDNYIKSFAQSAKSYGGPVILIPFEEMNGDWYPWSGTQNGNTPQKHITAYRRIRDMFRDVPNVKFGWTVNDSAVPNTQANQLENYYPGADYVDYVGVDGFNFGNPWLSFDQIFGNDLTRLAKFTKPVYIFSMASAEGPQKAAWITDALEVQIPKHPEIAGWLWFNENKEKDWRVWSSTQSLNAFINGLP